MQSSHSFSKDEGLVAYWPFDNGTQDKTGNHNDGNIILQAVSMVFSPDGRLFFSVKDGGEIRIMMNNGTILGRPFVRLRDPVTNVHHEILGITLDPDFSTNHYVYAYYRIKDSNTDNIFNRVIRFTEFQNRGIDQKVLIDNIHCRKRNRYMQGPLHLVQIINSTLQLTTASTKWNKIKIRQFRERFCELIGMELSLQTILFQNRPFIHLGHLNMFGIAFDKTTGIAIVTENDPSHYDEINVLGRRKLWVSNQKEYNSADLLQENNESAIKPARTYYKTVTPTQALYYDGNKFPYLKGKFLIASIW